MEGFPGLSRNLMTVLPEYTSENIGLASDGFARKMVVVDQTNILKGDEIHGRQQVLIRRT